MKNKLNETGTDLGKDLSMTKITNVAFSDSTDTPNEPVFEMLRWADRVDVRTKLYEIFRHIRCEEDLDMLMRDIAGLEKGVRLYLQMLKGGAMQYDY